MLSHYLLYGLGGYDYARCSVVIGIGLKHRPQPKEPPSYAAIFVQGLITTSLKKYSRVTNA